MPLKLNVGLCRKVGLPDYGSMGASCNVEIELDASLLQHDREALQRHIAGAYDSCRQAIEEQLAEPTGTTAAHGAQTNGHSHGSANGNGHSRFPDRNGNGRMHASNGNGKHRRATNSQVRAIHAIADRQRIDLTTELQNRFGISSAEELSIAEASQLIDALKEAQQTNGGGR